MTAGEIDRGVDHFRTAGAIGEFGDPENETAASLQMFQPGSRGEVVGLGAFRSDLRKRVDDLPEMARARCRQKLLLDSASVDEQGGLVSSLHDGLSERDGRAGRLIELRDGEEKILVRKPIAKG